MRPISRYLSWTAVVTALALPATAPSQQPLDPIQVSARASKADKLDARAAEYEAAGDVRKWGKAAGLREKAAGLRAAEDPRGFASLRQAAFHRHALRQRPAALDLMERAGDQALARGDVLSAATAYVEVAYIAAELRDAERVRHFVSKGSLLMHSPLLSAPERAALQRRVAQASTLTREVAVLTPP